MWQRCRWSRPIASTRSAALRPFTASASPDTSGDLLNHRVIGVSSLGRAQLRREFRAGQSQRIRALRDGIVCRPRRHPRCCPRPVPGPRSSDPSPHTSRPRRIGTRPHGAAPNWVRGRPPVTNGRALFRFQRTGGRAGWRVSFGSSASPATVPEPAYLDFSSRSTGNWIVCLQTLGRAGVSQRPRPFVRPVRIHARGEPSDPWRTIRRREQPHHRALKAGPAPARP